MDGDNSIVLIIPARKQSFSLNFFYHVAQCVEFAPDIGAYILAFTRQFQIGAYIVLAAVEIRMGRQRAFQTFAFAHDLLRLFGVGPQIRV